MSGSPLLRLALVLIGLALLAIPALRLSGRTSPAPPAPTGGPGGECQTLTLRFSSPLPPDEIQVRSADRTLATLHPHAIPVSTEISLSLPSHGTDLIVSASWPQPAAAQALRVEVSLRNRPLFNTTLWSHQGRKLEDILTLPGLPHP